MTNLIEYCWENCSARSWFNISADKKVEATDYLELVLIAPSSHPNQNMQNRQVVLDNRLSFKNLGVYLYPAVT